MATPRIVVGRRSFGDSGSAGLESVDDVVVVAVTSELAVVKSWVSDGVEVEGPSMADEVVLAEFCQIPLAISLVIEYLHVAPEGGAKVARYDAQLESMGGAVVVTSPTSNWKIVASASLQQFPERKSALQHQEVISFSESQSNRGSRAKVSSVPFVLGLFC